MGVFAVLFQEFESVMGLGLLELLITEIPGTLINLAVYIFIGLGLYTIAKRRGIRNPWLAWVPVARLWLLGCISDQYQSVVKNKATKRRVVLVMTRITILVVSIVVLAACVMLLISIFAVGMDHLGTTDTSKLLAEVMTPLLGLVLLAMLLIPVTIVYTVFYYIALFDVYKSCDPSNATLYLVVSIFIGCCVPIFLVICRDKDGGMLVRQPQPADEALPNREPWEREGE